MKGDGLLKIWGWIVISLIIATVILTIIPDKPWYITVALVSFICMCIVLVRKYPKMTDEEKQKYINEIKERFLKGERYPKTLLPLGGK